MLTFAPATAAGGEVFTVGLGARADDALPTQGTRLGHTVVVASRAIILTPENNKQYSLSHTLLHLRQTIKHKWPDNLEHNS